MYSATDASSSSFVRYIFRHKLPNQEICRKVEILHHQTTTTFRTENRTDEQTAENSQKENGRLDTGIPISITRKT